MLRCSKILDSAKVMATKIILCIHPYLPTNEELLEEGPCIREVVLEDGMRLFCCYSFYFSVFMIETKDWYEFRIEWRKRPEDAREKEKAISVLHPCFVYMDD